MNPWFSVNDGSALYGILAEIAGDIILKTDADGFIEHASPDLNALGVDLSSLLIAPHIADLADQAHSAAVRAYFRDACNGCMERDRIEFALPRSLAERLDSGEAGDRPRYFRRWFALRVRPVPMADKGTGGALALLRAIEPRKLNDQYWSCDELTDQLTGIANRRAFTQTLSEYLASDRNGAVALFEVDAFRALCLRLGQGSGEAMLRAFADFIGVVRQEGEMVARIDGPRFAVLMPGNTPENALVRAREIIATFAELSQNAGASNFPISASAGLARLSGTQHETLSRAERALILANAAGGARAELFEAWPAYLAQSRGAGAQSPLSLG